MKVLIVGTGGQIEGKLLGRIAGAARDFRLWIAKLKTALGRWLPEWQDDARSVVATLAAQLSS